MTSCFVAMMPVVPGSAKLSLTQHQAASTTGTGDQQAVPVFGDPLLSLSISLTTQIPSA